LDREKRESVAFSLRIDNELFPILGGAADRPESVCQRLEERIMKLPKQKLVTERFVGLITRFEELLPRLPEEKKQEGKAVIADLKQKLKSLTVSWVVTND
jgi:hypothetical protein